MLPKHGSDPPKTRQVGADGRSAGPLVAPDVALVAPSDDARRLGSDNLENGGRELRTVALADGGEDVGGCDRHRRGRRVTLGPVGEGFGDLGGREPWLPIEFAGAKKLRTVPSGPTTNMEAAWASISPIAPGWLLSIWCTSPCRPRTISVRARSPHARAGSAGSMDALK